MYILLHKIPVIPTGSYWLTQIRCLLTQTHTNTHELEL